MNYNQVKREGGGDTGAETRFGFPFLDQVPYRARPTLSLWSRTRVAFSSEEGAGGWDRLKLLPPSRQGGEKKISSDLYSPTCSAEALEEELPGSAEEQPEPQTRQTHASTRSPGGRHDGLHVTAGQAGSEVNGGFLVDRIKEGRGNVKWPTPPRRPKGERRCFFSLPRLAFVVPDPQQLCSALGC